ncbi:MAG: selenide, water dikinase SelD [Clostridia bacterium]
MENENRIKLTKLSKCAGCGAKVGAGTLKKLLTDIKTIVDPNLLVGFDRSDDASVYKIADNSAIVQTVDFFPPVADDPYLFGAIAAANALSDIYAMGGEPKLAQNILMIPNDMPGEYVREILHGGYDKAFEAGTIITGGHSVFDPEPKYGLAVTGFVAIDNLLTNSGAKPGDVLFFTKRLGTGIALAAHRENAASKFLMDSIYESMMTLNKAAKNVCSKYRVNACTDVTGFSILGHSLEMALGSGTGIVLEASKIPIFEDILELAKIDMLPGGMYRNREFAEDSIIANNIDKVLLDTLFSPETSGGLLISVDSKDEAAFFNELKNTIKTATRIGFVTDKHPGFVEII